MKAISVVDTVALKTNAGTVIGNVTLESAETSEGIAILIAKENDNAVSYNTITDTRGHYAVTGIAPGTYRVQATKNGYNTGISDPFTVSSGVTSTPSDMILSISLRALYGTVTLEGKTDYTGVRITATKTTSTKEIYSALSNKDGFYALSGMTPGEYILSYSYEGYRSYTSSSVSLSGDSSLDLDDIQLMKATGKISGIVNLEGCTDHSGITVTLVGTNYSYTTESDGNYEFTVPSGNYPGGVRFEKTDYQLTAKAETIPVLTDSTYGVLTVEMKATANTVKGVVTLAGATDHSGIKVSVDGQNAISCTTAANGVWQLDHVPLGYQTIRFQKTNVPDMTVEREIIPSDYIDIGTLEMIPDSATLKGFVFLDGMTDHAGIKITVATANKDDIVVRTTSDGAFIVNNILASVGHTITFSKEGWNNRSITINDFEPLEVRSVGSNHEYVLTDTTAPSISAVTINNGANFTSSPKLNVGITAEDKGSGIEKMAVQVIAKINGVERDIYPTAYSWQNYKVGFEYDLETLPSSVYVGNGTYTLVVSLRDKSGNISQSAQKAITLTNVVTTLNGVLTGDKLHLTKEQSPYLVVADCVVAENKTLVIDPGTEIRFDGDFCILVRGEISARGTNNEKILFTKSDTCEVSSFDFSNFHDKYYWNGIIIDGSTMEFDDNLEYVSGNIMEYCEVEYAKQPLNVNFAAYIAHCHFHDNIKVSGMFQSGILFSVDNNVVLSNIFENGVHCCGYIINNRINGDSDICGSYGNGGLFCYNTVVDGNISFAPYDKNVFYGNVFENKNLNISIMYYNWILTGNNFVDCPSPIVSTEMNYYSGHFYDFRGNYWGAANTEELNIKGAEDNISFISDFYDNFRYMRIAYDNWLQAPNDDAGYKGDDWEPTSWTDINLPAELDGVTYTDPDDSISINYSIIFAKLSSVKLYLDDIEIGNDSCSDLYVSNSSSIDLSSTSAGQHTFKIEVTLQSGDTVEKSCEFTVVRTH